MTKKIILNVILGGIIILSLVGCQTKQNNKTTAKVQQKENVEPKEQQKPPKQLTKEEQRKEYLDEFNKANRDFAEHKRAINELQEEFDRVIDTPDLLDYHIEKIEEILGEFKNIKPYEGYKEQYGYYIKGVQYHLDIYEIMKEYASKKIDIRNNKEYDDKIKLIDDKLIACMNRAFDKMPLTY